MLRKFEYETVFYKIGKSFEVLAATKRGKLEYVGDIMRNPKYLILQLIVQEYRDWKSMPMVQNQQLFRSAAMKVHLCFLQILVRVPTISSTVRENIIM